MLAKRKNAETEYDENSTSSDFLLIAHHQPTFTFFPTCLHTENGKKEKQRELGSGGIGLLLPP